MSELPTLVWPLLGLLALLMGFVADRTMLCTVGAVAEVMNERRGVILWNILRIVLWILGVTLLLGYGFGVTPFNNDRFELGWIGLAGGFVFGVGAVFNGGCSLQTLTRLGRGSVGMIFSILGMPVGAALARFALVHNPQLIPQRDTTHVVMGSWMQVALMLLLGLWMCTELYRLLRDYRFADWKKRLLAPEYKAGSSAALMGIANGVLFSLVGTWMFTYTLLQTMTNVFYPDSQLVRAIPSQLWWLLAAYVVGIFLSAIQSHHLLLAARPDTAWLRYCFGGALMGFGAALVPGGNDMLLLNGIPGLSSHALPAYLSMLVGIAVALSLLTKWYPDNEFC